MKLTTEILTPDETRALNACCKRRKIGRGYYVLPWRNDGGDYWPERVSRAVKGRAGANHFTRYHE